MSDDVELKLRIDHVLVAVEEATAEVLKALAFRIVEGAQLNIRQNNQIDTGFMVNSAYAIWKDGDTYDQAQAEAEQQTSDRLGYEVDHTGDMAPKVDLIDGAAAGVVFGANYAIYQEAVNPFLYPAAQRAAAEFRGEAEQIYREEMPDE